jgi:hypothetical protein
MPGNEIISLDFRPADWNEQLDFTRAYALPEDIEIGESSSIAALAKAIGIRRGVLSENRCCPKFGRQHR